ncbi:MAG: PAS domain-containing protein [Candidatus Fermentibacteraceae bacterium]|nr:PAS domain-containing protein [Candidatus Fermentibacteraceae bacterium]
MKVDGDLFAVLGVNADKLIQSSDPFSLLPNSVARGLIEGGEIARDQGLVVIPGKSGTSNTVTLIAEQTVDYDLISDMAGGVVGFAPDGTIVQWNMRMTLLFGPGEKDVEGRTASEILPSPVLYDWDSVISSAHLGHEVRVEFKPSSEKRVEGVLSRGGPGVIGLFRDSTESFRTSKRLRALNRLNQAYLLSTGTGLLLLDSRLRVLLSNSGFTRITGNRGSLIGLQLHDILSEDSYRWVHDASEHLFAEESAEQSGIVSFTNRDGREVTFHQTLRAVRNETNQALNFVCLFEDETDITRYRDEVDHLRKNLLGISRISGKILKSETDFAEGLCEEILRITRSSAVALFSYDTFETVRLAGSAGSWPKGFPADELGKFGFPAFVWNTDKQYKVTSTELGKLSGHFSSCTILPVGTGVSNQGYLVFADSVISVTDTELFETVSSLVRIQKDLVLEKTARSAAEKHLELNEGFARTLLNGIPLPLAIIRMDGKIVHWNHVMETVCGIKAAEVDTYDIKNLIDPAGSGFTLDSRASACSQNNRGISCVWAVTREDRTQSAVYRWNVSIVDESTGYQGDPAFLVAGVPWDSEVIPAESREWYNQSGNTLLDRVTQLFSAETHADRLEKLANVCFSVGGGGMLEFSAGGRPVAVFPSEAENREHDRLNSRSSAVIDEIEYQIATSSNISRETLRKVVQLLSIKHHHAVGTENTAKRIREEIIKYSTGLSGYLEQFSSVAIEQNNSILHVMNSDDPLAGFARTMLYSTETASRVTHILGLTVQVNQGVFSEEYPDRFLGRLHGVFAETGLRPPSLSIEDKIPPVAIKTEVLLKCFVLLCQLAVLDDIVSFNVSKAENGPGRQEIFLTLQGLNDSFRKLSSDEIRNRLESGRFNSETEAAIIFRILEAAGCSLSSVKGGTLVFAMYSTR